MKSLNEFLDEAKKIKKGTKVKLLKKGIGSGFGFGLDGVITKVIETNFDDEYMVKASNGKTKRLTIDDFELDEATKTKAVLGGKTKLYMITTKNGKDIVLVALNDKDARHKASLIGDNIKKVTRLDRKHAELYTV